MADRFSLFMFYWNSKKMSNLKYEMNLAEPLRVIIITQPRPNVLRVFYNQASPDGSGHLKFVNSYDPTSSRLLKIPLIPDPMVVYKNFKERILYVPVIHVSKSRILIL